MTPWNGIEHVPAAILDRRAVVTGGLAAAAIGAYGRTSAIAIAQDSQTIATPDQLVCVLTPEQTEGPYSVDDALIRDDITDGQSGLPLRLAITVVDTDACQPLPDVAVDIWHCDAQGYYSGVAGAARTRNDQDGILAGHEREPGFFIELAPVDESGPAAGYDGTITVGVAPA